MGEQMMELEERDVSAEACHTEAERGVVCLRRELGLVFLHILRVPKGRNSLRAMSTSLRGTTDPASAGCVPALLPVLQRS